jgi:hypothetical protein
VVEDDRGVRFVRVYAGRGENNLLIYKRETAAPGGAACLDYSRDRMACRHF